MAAKAAAIPAEADPSEGEAPLPRHPYTGCLLAETPRSRYAIPHYCHTTGEHSVILTFPRDAVDDVRTPDPKYPYTWHSAALTSGCCRPHTTRPPSVSAAHDTCTC